MNGTYFPPRSKAIYLLWLNTEFQKAKMTNLWSNSSHIPRLMSSMYSLAIINSLLFTLFLSSSHSHMHAHVYTYIQVTGTQTHMHGCLLYLYEKVNSPSSIFRTLMHCCLVVHFEQCSVLLPSCAFEQCSIFLCVAVQVDQCTKCVAFQWKTGSKSEVHVPCQAVCLREEPFAA